MNGWTAPEDDVDLLRGELDACREELLRLRRLNRALISEVSLLRRNAPTHSYVSMLRRRITRDG